MTKSETQAKQLFIELENLMTKGIKGGVVKSSGELWDYEYLELEDNGRKFFVMCGKHGNFQVNHKWDEDEERMYYFTLNGIDENEVEFYFPFEKKLAIVSQ